MRAGIVAARAYSSGLTEALVVPYMRSVSEQVRMLCSDARSEDIDRWLASTLSRLEAQSVVAAASASTADASASAVSSSSSSSISSSNSSNDGGVGVVEGKVPTAEVVTSSEVNPPSAAPLDEESDALVARARAELPALLLRFFRTGFEVLEAIKLDMANSHLSQLLESDHSLRHAIASRPNDFVILLNAADTDPSMSLGEGEHGDLGVPLHDHHLPPNVHHASQHAQHHLHEQHHRLPSHLGDGHTPGLGHSAVAGIGSAAAAADGRAAGSTIDGEHALAGSMLAAGGAVGGVHVSDGLHSRLRRRMDAYPDDDDEGADGIGGLTLGERGRAEDDDDDDEHDGEEEGYDDGTGDPGEYGGPYGIAPSHHHHHHDGGAALGGELPGPPEMHSELMEAVMQQWLHTPAGQSAAQEAARLELSTEEVGQFFHARMLQSLGRLRLGGAPEPSLDQLRVAVGSLPEDDEAAVQRLVALGFTREQAAEAYLACERNEMLAANFLMDHQ